MFFAGEEHLSAGDELLENTFEPQSHAQLHVPTSGFQTTSGYQRLLKNLMSR